jgi:hypothetical protein
MWCWWCCHPWEGPDLHLPYKYDDKTKKFTTLGHFCSWNCIKAYNTDKYALSRAGEIGMYITLMHKQTTNKLELIPSAPSRYALKVFGGTLDIEEFRKSDGNSMVTMPNETHKLHGVVETGKREVKKLTQAALDVKMDEISRSTTKNETLKLKRNKPLKRDKGASVFEKSLGINQFTF